MRPEAIKQQDEIMTDEATRDALRAKIDAGEKRNAERSLAERASDAGDSVTQFAKDHPVAAIAAGVTIGVIVAGIFNRGKVARGASRMGSYASELGTAYGLSMLDAARSGKDSLEDFGDTLEDRARATRRGAASQASFVADAAHMLKRRASRTASRSARDIRNTIKR